nr:hypothetical protein Iba_chr13dCG6010 [Ipomoea batatas]
MVVPTSSMVTDSSGDGSIKECYEASLYISRMIIKLILGTCFHIANRECY